ncbi:7TM diverse intracellular signaling domain-containing protein [Polaromonas sp.]|uniref:sensor domain-containing diguanylate cyclase n=1 Tax=Polaromonas sp. TaxID=1869339 RepID=UPI00286CF7AF|nr:7TM diverse intracellular signaling domain-containing protein [Polaromonas sp.]
MLLHAPVAGQTASSLQAVGPFARIAGDPGQGSQASRVLLDAAGQFTVEQVHGRFEAGEGRAVNQAQIMPAAGGGALWYRVELPSLEQPTALVLTVPHPGMDSVNLYRPATPANADADSSAGQWQVQRSGDHIATAAWPLRYLYPAFGFQVQPGESQPTYLRVTHSFPISVYWTLSDARSFHETSKQWHLLLGVYIGLVVVLVLLSVFHALAWRDPVHFFFAVLVLVIALGQLSLTGLAGEYFWPGSAGWNDSAPLVLSLASAALLHLFLRQLVAEREASWLSWWLLLMTLVGGLLTAAHLALGREAVFAYTGPYFLASMASYLLAAFWYARRRPRVGLWVLAATVSLGAGAVFPVLRNMSLMSLNAATQFGAQAGSALEVLLLLVALSQRNRERRDNQLRVGAMASVDALTGVANHRILLQRLDQLLLRQQREPGVGAVLRIRLGNASEIRNEYGLEVAQNAMVHAGTCITGVAHEGDTVARHRDGDFVLILREAMTQAQLTGLGQRLIAHGLAESPALPPGTVLRLKLAVAPAPFQTTDAGSLLQSLGEVLDGLAGRAGTALRFANSRAPRGDTQPQ